MPLAYTSPSSGYVPAPYIVSDLQDGVEVVTVVTEAPLSYSGLKLKIGARDGGNVDRPSGGGRDSGNLA